VTVDQNVTAPDITLNGEDLQGNVLVADDAPQVHWNDFGPWFARQWGQGQHVAIIGPTDSGKSTLAYNLLPIHIWVVIFATKPRDKTLNAMTYSPKGVRNKVPAGQYVKLDKWKNLNMRKYPRRILWPNALDLYSSERQRQVFQEALSIIYREGGWTVYLDELWFMSADLGLTHEVRTYLQQSRSNEVTLVVSSQRPSRIPVEVYDQSRHLFFSRDNDERNLSRISGIAWKSRKIIMNYVANLEPHEFLYVNTRSGIMCRIVCPELRYEKKGK
jgi:hypothetical protein